jgi:hypothetical protein
MALDSGVLWQLAALYASRLLLRDIPMQKNIMSVSDFTAQDLPLFQYITTRRPSHKMVRTRLEGETESVCVRMVLVLKPRDPILALVTVRVNVSALIGSALSGPPACKDEEPELMPGVWERSISFSPCFFI